MSPESYKKPLFVVNRECTHYIYNNMNYCNLYGRSSVNLWNLLGGVGFWIAAKRPDDATDRTGVDGDWRGKAAVKHSRRRIAFHKRCKIILKYFRQTPAIDAFLAERMPVVAPITSSHRAEAKTAQHQKNKMMLRQDGCHDVRSPPCGQCQCLALFICIIIIIIIYSLINYKPMGLKTEKKRKQTN